MKTRFRVQYSPLQKAWVIQYSKFPLLWSDIRISIYPKKSDALFNMDLLYLKEKR